MHSRGKMRKKVKVFLNISESRRCRSGKLGGPPKSGRGREGGGRSEKGSRAVLPPPPFPRITLSPWQSPSHLGLIMPHSRLPSPAPGPAVNTRWWERSSAETGPGLCIRERWTVGRTNGRTNGRTDGQTDGRTDRQNRATRMWHLYNVQHHSSTTHDSPVSLSFSPSMRMRVWVCICVCRCVGNTDDEMSAPAQTAHTQPPETTRNRPLILVATSGGDEVA